MGGSDSKVAQYSNRSKGKATCTIDNLGRVNGIQRYTNWIWLYRNSFSKHWNTFYCSCLQQRLQLLTQGDNGFHVTSFDITQAGFGYTVAPEVTISAPPVFRTATGITSFKDGQLISVTITDQGANYYDPPAVSFDIEPEPVVVTEVNDIYSANNKVYRWNGTQWELQLTKAFEYMDSQGVIQELKGQ